MGLVTDDLSSLLTDIKDDPREDIEGNPFGAGVFSLAASSRDSGWHHAVHRLRKWLRTTLAAHGGHGDGLTR